MPADPARPGAGRWAAAAALAAAAVVQTSLPLISVRWLAGAVWLVPALVIAGWRKRSLQDAGAPASDVLPGLVLLAGAFILLLSGASRNLWFYFADWAPGSSLRSLLLTGGPARMFILMSLFIILDRAAGRRTALLLWALLPSLPLFFFWRLMSATGGAALWQHDHSSTMFRLWAFSRVFPSLVFYNPLWNGGYMDISLISSGTPAAGTLLFPLYAAFCPHQVHNLAVLILMAVLTPLAAGAAVYMAGGGRVAALSAGVLAMGVSRSQFLWSSAYGTVAGTFCSVMLVPAAAALYRLTWRGGRTIPAAAALVGSAFLAFIWPPAVLMALPLLAALLFSAGRLDRRKLLVLVLCGVLLAVLLLPFVRGVTARFDLGRFNRDDPLLDCQRPPGGFLASGWRIVVATLRGGHPLILFLGLAGVWFLPRPGVRRYYGTITAGLLALAAWGQVLKPQYELARAAIPLFYMATLPAGLWVDKIMADGSPAAKPFRAFLLTMLVLGGLNSGLLHAGGGVSAFSTAAGEAEEFSSWVREHTRPDDRVLFAGPALHAVGRGHVAYLPVLAGREMMSVDHYHVSPLKFEYQYPPRPFGESAEGVARFTRLYGVALVAGWEQDRLAMLRSRPDLFEEVFSFGTEPEKVVCRVRGSPSGLFLEGSGRVAAGPGRIDVELDDPRSEAVIRYNWLDELTADGPAEIFPRRVEEGIVFIGIRPNGAKRVTVRPGRRR